MHEMGIASSVLEIIREEVNRHPLHRPEKVGLRIGEYAGVEPESLRFGFEALVKGSEWEGLELEIDWRLESEELDIAYIELESLVDESSEELVEESGVV